MAITRQRPEEHGAAHAPYRIARALLQRFASAHARAYQARQRMRE
jgi:hypothetical protein